MLEPKLLKITKGEKEEENFQAVLWSVFAVGFTQFNPFFAL